MNESKIIKAVKLDLDGKEVDLTIEQAKKLHVALNELFGEKIVKEVVHEHTYLPSPVPWPVDRRPFWEGGNVWGTQTTIGDGPGQFTSTSGVVATFDQQSDSGTLTLKVA